MGILNKIFGTNKPAKRKKGYRPPRTRGYMAGDASRLTNDWVGSSANPNDEIYSRLAKIRARARDLGQNNEYARRFINLCKTNIVGPAGIQLQVRSMNKQGQPDEWANNEIETAWKRWTKKGVCTIDGGLSFIDLQKMIVESVFCSGEIIVRKVYGAAAGNEFKFALRVYEGDHLDENLNRDLGNGNKIIMGVEINRFYKPVAYWVLKDHPGGWVFSNIRNDHERIPADQILFLGIPERPGQLRYISPMVTAMYRAKMLNGYEEAELVAARTAAAKMGFFYEEMDPDAYTGDDIEGDEDNHDLISEAEPGIIERLPQGVRFEPWSPEHPTTAFDSFVKSGVRAMASALNVSYASLSSDLTQVSYSSIRQGAIEERDNWRDRQQWLIDHFLTDVFETFLKFYLTLPTTVLPIERFDKYNAPVWGPRGWDWVDPLKEVLANVKAIEQGFKNVSDVCAEKGRDFEEVLKRRKADQELAKKYGFTLPALISAMGTNGNGNDNGQDNGTI
jgi:lambda family phage portal protein